MTIENNFDDSLEKLAKLSELAEDLSAQLFDVNNKVVSDKFKKIASYSRRIATCVRVNGQIPIERENKIKQGIKTIQSAVDTLKSAGQMVGKNL